MNKDFYSWKFCIMKIYTDSFLYLSIRETNNLIVEKNDYYDKSFKVGYSHFLNIVMITQFSYKDRFIFFEALHYEDV